MIKKIILFGDMKLGESIAFKSAAISRLTYALRKKGYDVKQIHHCTNFSFEELRNIVTNFSKGEKVCVGVSTSFISDNDVKKKQKYFWGNSSFLFLLNLGKICKNLGFPYILGGWEIKENLLYDRSGGWGYNELSNFVTYFVEGKDTAIIEDICNNKIINYKLINNKIKLAFSKETEDFSDCASTFTKDDIVFEKESVCTEVAAGCIFSCSFCTYAALGKKKNEYTRTYESFEKEITENYNNFKIHLYNLTDNIVNDTPEKIRYLIDVRDKTGIDFKWSGYVRLDTIQNIEQAKLLKNSGMVCASFGIESFYKNSGKYIGKITDKNRLMKSLDIMRTVFDDQAVFSGLFIAGLPEEPIDHILQTHQWLNSIEGRNYIDHYQYTAFKLYDNNEDKNEINKSRNNPFRDYIIIESSHEVLKKSKTRGSINLWTSPWTTYEQVHKMCRTIESERMNKLGGGFFLPYLVNCGYNLDFILKEIRNCGKQGIPFFPKNIKNTKNYISDYKKRILFSKED
jgi:hypothetical protein